MLSFNIKNRNYKTIAKVAEIQDAFAILATSELSEGYKLDYNGLDIWDNYVLGKPESWQQLEQTMETIFHYEES